MNAHGMNVQGFFAERCSGLFFNTRLLAALPLQYE